MRAAGWAFVLVLAIAVDRILHAQIAVTPLAVRVYTVTRASAFPALPICKCLVHRNGLFQSPGIDYTLTAAGIVFGVGFLQDGDQIEIVTLP